MWLMCDSAGSKVAGPEFLFVTFLAGILDPAAESIGIFRYFGGP